MFQFRRFPSYTYLFSIWCCDVTHSGLLHSDICGSILACNSPQLFAAYRVLHRLPMPRHPPCALISLTVSILRIELRVASQLFLILVSNGSELCLSHYEKFYFVVFLPRCFTCVRYYTFSSLHYFCFIQFSKCFLRYFVSHGGHKWTRTTDLTLIRRAL